MVAGWEPSLVRWTGGRDGTGFAGFRVQLSVGPAPRHPWLLYPACDSSRKQSINIALCMRPTDRRGRLNNTECVGSSSSTTGTTRSLRCQLKPCLSCAVSLAIGFNVETVQYKNIKFQVWDLGGALSQRLCFSSSPAQPSLG